MTTDYSKLPERLILILSPKECLLIESLVYNGSKNIHIDYNERNRKDLRALLEKVNKLLETD
jgi:hypothetical protein